MLETTLTATELEQNFQENENFRLEITNIGLLETLKFQPFPRIQPESTEVEIEVLATGLNFKDVLRALGVIPPEPNTPLTFGLECAGKIVSVGKQVTDFQVGDEVMAFSSHCFSKYITVPTTVVAKIPPSISIEEAATIPVAFMTAYYGLIELAKLQRGEKVLIHAATGGVGLAAVKIAQWVGAEIFATAGNPEKQAFLQDMGIKYVMSSRSLDYAEQVMKHTNNQGVDVILNSLAGEFIAKNFAIMAKYGRFIEIGMRDIYSNTQLGLEPFKNGLSLFALLVGPELPKFSSIFHDLVRKFEQGSFTPLPMKVFNATSIREAFEYMARAKHLGKIVISFPALDTHNSQRTARNGTSTPVINPGSTNRLNRSQVVSQGILPQEGVEAFKRILRGSLSQVVVSTTDLTDRLKQATKTSGGIFFEESQSQQPTAAVAHPRPQLSNAYVAPLTDTEKKVAKIWQDYLGILEVGVHDNFLDLGGDSLLATQIIARLREAFDVKLSLASLFEFPTVAQMADNITKLIDVEQGNKNGSQMEEREEIEI
jgi:NADPH:quinone reductase-like Zn-dependent oxidoreductase/acyl carrier protein